MKKLSFFLLASFTVIFGCKTSTNQDNAENIDSTENFIHPNTTTFYQTENENQAIVIAESIIYDVVIQNTQYGNEWQNECSYYTYANNVDVDAFANILFQAVYEERLVPYSIMRDGTLTIEEVKQLEADNKRDAIAKLEFTEKWYFNENTLQMSKKITEIAFGYERVNLQGEVLNYSPGFKVYLDNPEMNKIAQ